MFCKKKVANKTKQTNGTANDERAGIVQALDDDLSAGEDPKGGHPESLHSMIPHQR